MDVCVAVADTSSNQQTVACLSRLAYYGCICHKHILLLEQAAVNQCKSQPSREACVVLTQ